MFVSLTVQCVVQSTRLCYSLYSMLYSVSTGPPLFLAMNNYIFVFLLGRCDKIVSDRFISSNFFLYLTGCLPPPLYVCSDYLWFIVFGLKITKYKCVIPYHCLNWVHFDNDITHYVISYLCLNWVHFSNDDTHCVILFFVCTELT